MEEPRARLLYLDIVEDGAKPAEFVPSDNAKDLLDDAEVRIIVRLPRV